VILARFADDLLAGFERREDAERFLADLRERFAEFGLELHPVKTRLIEFGRFATSTPHPSPLAERALRRQNPREEPSALTRTLGSVRGAASNGGPYRDRRPLALKYSRYYRASRRRQPRPATRRITTLIPARTLTPGSEIR